MTVKDYNDIIIGNMKLALDDCEVTGPDEAAFGNFEGYTTQMRAVAEKLKITYWVTCIESDTDFIQITSWTLQSKEAANKTILSDVVKTFKLK